MDNKQNRQESSANDLDSQSNPNAQQSAPDKRESGEPGGGQGRRDEVGATGVYPLGAENIPPDVQIRMAGSWGGGDYYESGGSELVYREGMLLGGLSAGPDGEPTINIHEHGNLVPIARGDATRTDDESDVAAVDPVELRLRGLPKTSEGASAQQRDTRGKGA